MWFLLSTVILNNFWSCFVLHNGAFWITCLHYFTVEMDLKKTHFLMVSVVSGILLMVYWSYLNNLLSITGTMSFSLLRISYFKTYQHPEVKILSWRSWHHYFLMTASYAGIFQIHRNHIEKKPQQPKQKPNPNQKTNEQVPPEKPEPQTRKETPTKPPPQKNKTTKPK